MGRGSPLGPRRRRRRHARSVLTLDEPRAAPVRSGWAGASQKSRENGGKVVRKRGTGVKICTVKYCGCFLLFSKTRGGRKHTTGTKIGPYSSSIISLIRMMRYDDDDISSTACYI